MACKRKLILVSIIIFAVVVTFSACDFIQGDVEEELEDYVEEEPEEEIPEVVAIDGMFYYYKDSHTIVLDVENRGGNGEITIELKTRHGGPVIIRETYKVAPNKTYEYRWEYIDSSEVNSFNVYIYSWDGKEYVKTDEVVLLKRGIGRP